MTTQLVTTVPDAAAATGYKTPRQFVKAWKAAGLRVLTPSPRKHVVYVSDIARFLNQSKETKLD